MNTVKTIQKAHRGVTALMLVLFFCIAGLTKLFASNPVSLYKASQKSTTKAVFSAVEKQGEVTAPADASDNDADDLDYLPLVHDSFIDVVLAEINSNKQIIIYFHKVSRYSNHLYDLYCNWKYDLE